MSEMSLLCGTAAVVFVISSVAVPAGVGGGLLYVPVLVLTKVASTSNQAAALSQTLVVSATLAGSIFNLIAQSRRPRDGREAPPRLIQTDIAAAAMGPLFGGVIAGALLNEVLPQLSILVLLLVVICWNFFRVINKARMLWKNESRARAMPAASPRSRASNGRMPKVAFAVDDAPASAELGPVADASCMSLAAGVQRSTSDAQNLARPAGPIDDLELVDIDLGPASPSRGDIEGGVLAEPACSGGGVPAAEAPPSCEKGGALGAGCHSSVWNLFGLWVLVVIAIAVRGGRHTPSLFAMCSWQYWAATVFSCALMVVLGVALRHPQISTGACVGIGTLSAIVGIGGGLMLSPMLLNNGLDPARTSATVTLMMLMVSVAATFAFLLAGQLELLPVGVVGTAAFFGALFGRTVVGWAIRRSGRQSILLFLLCGFMVVAGSVVAGESLKQVFDITGGNRAALDSTAFVGGDFAGPPVTLCRAAAGTASATAPGSRGRRS
eukprot:CAMPEP_0170276266 /NCGR_PEP_ID=MMETSP0116_2-20130129/38118_1 /TAXON_ID=400756 /ORGANISM="Durinskia baltica, Strain CSIRO CS-38" /LENGTH=494 /DNA_ID=CAMNT_0010527539 /DNA_START=1 /DNA_END=1482 /DNA_ORIENTATION=-